MLKWKNECGRGEMELYKMLLLWDKKRETGLKYTSVKLYKIKSGNGRHVWREIPLRDCVYAVAGALHNFAQLLLFKWREKHKTNRINYFNLIICIWLAFNCSFSTENRPHSFCSLSLSLSLEIIKWILKQNRSTIKCTFSVVFQVDFRASFLSLFCRGPLAILPLSSFKI